MLDDSAALNIPPREAAPAEQTITLTVAEFIAAAEQFMKAKTLPKRKHPTVESVMFETAVLYRCTKADILGIDRHKGTARARKVAMYVARQVLGLSYPELGRSFKRDHTTVMSACKSIEKALPSDTSLRADVEWLERELNGLPHPSAIARGE